MTRMAMTIGTGSMALTPMPGAALYRDNKSGVRLFLADNCGDADNCTWGTQDPDVVVVADPHVKGVWLAANLRVQEAVIVYLGSGDFEDVEFDEVVRKYGHRLGVRVCGGCRKHFVECGHGEYCSEECAVDCQEQW